MAGRSYRGVWAAIVGCLVLINILAVRTFGRFDASLTHGSLQPRN